jgi:hypothetical protein
VDNNSGNPPLPPPPPSAGYGFSGAHLAPTPKADPTFAWTLAFAPLLFVLVPLVFRTISDSNSLFIAVAVNVGLCVADRASLKKAGLYVDSGWVLLVPGYLIVRTKRAESTPAIPVVWFVSFLVSLALPTLIPATGGPVTMDSHKVEEQIVQAFRTQERLRVTVSCPHDPRVPINGQFTCNVTAPTDGSTARILVTVTDSDGRYTWQMVQ